MWKAVVIHGKGVVLPSLGEYAGWRDALFRGLWHMGLLLPGRYRLEEVGVDRVGDTAIVFAILTHSSGVRWILNAIAHAGASPALEAGACPDLEEVRGFMKNMGFPRRKWVLVEA